MKQKQFTTQSFSIVFLILTLFSAIWSNAGRLFRASEVQVECLALEKNANSDDESSDNQTFLTDAVSFDAVTNAGLQLDLGKGFVLPATIVRIFLIIKEKTTFCPVSIRLLGYFQNLFLSSILVNAP